MSRALKLPKKIGRPLLCDFGSTMIGKEYQTKSVQPNKRGSAGDLAEDEWIRSHL
jgi:hypothetical protein